MLTFIGKPENYVSDYAKTSKLYLDKFKYSKIETYLNFQTGLVLVSV